jgi:hypothetical protein
MANGDFTKGFIFGAAAMFVGGAILRALSESGGPLARAMGRGAMVVAEKAREAAAEIGEVIEDTAAELNAADAGEQAAAAETAKSAKGKPKAATAKAQETT